MLLATTIMLLVFRAPSVALAIMWLTSAKMFVNEKPPFRLRKFHTIANLSATLNAATTFVMFMIYGTKFRAEFTRIYCCCFKKFKERRSKTIIQNQEQQIKQLIPNDNNNDDEQPIDNRRNSSLHRKIQQGRIRYSSGTTTTTSISTGSLPPLRRLRNQRRKPRYPLEQQGDLTNQPDHQQQQYELTIAEDECNNQNNDRKSVTLKVSCSDWFKNLVHCR
jgi:hypothetical protein